MSGQRINDHSSWCGKGGGVSPLPTGNKTKSESSAGDFGGLTTYEDTTEMIKKQQNMNVSKVHGHPMKSGHRN